MIVFDGEDLVLHYYKSNSDYILVTFTGVGESHNAKKTFFAEPVVNKHNISCLGITCKKDSYYLHPEMEDIISICNDITRNYHKVIIIGLSMGGYGAIKFSQRLNADIVFVMSPAYTVDKELCPINDIAMLEAKRFPIQTVRDSTIKESDVQGKIYFAYDPVDAEKGYDAINNQYLFQIISNIVKVPVFYTGHVVIHHLKGSTEFKSIIDALVENNDQNVIKTVGNIRRHHINNIMSKFNASMIKHPLLVYKVIIGKDFIKIKNNDKLLKNNNFCLSLIHHLQINGYCGEAVHFFRICYSFRVFDNYLPNDTIFKKIKIHNLKNKYPYLISHHGYFLYYDINDNKIIMSNSFVGVNGCIPIQLYINGFYVKLICIINKCMYELKYNKNKKIFFLSSDLKYNKKDSILVNFNGLYATFNVINDHLFAIAIHNHIDYTSPHSWGWERFAAILQ